MCSSYMAPEQIQCSYLPALHWTALSLAVEGSKAHRGCLRRRCQTAVSHWRGRSRFLCFTSYLVKHKDLLCGPCTPSDPGCSVQQPQLCLPLCQYLSHAEVLSAAIWYLLPYQMQTLNNVWPTTDLSRTILGSPPLIASFVICYLATLSFIPHVAHPHFIGIFLSTLCVMKSNVF